MRTCSRPGCGRSGQRYVLNGATLTSTDALQLVSNLSGIQDKVPLVSPAVARGAATIAEWVFRIRGTTPPVCRARVDTILHGHRYDGSLAARELGLRYTPVPRRSVARSGGPWPKALSRARCQGRVRHQWGSRRSASAGRRPVTPRLRNRHRSRGCRLPSTATSSGSADARIRPQHKHRFTTQLPRRLRSTELIYLCTWAYGSDSGRPTALPSVASWRSSAL